MQYSIVNYKIVKENSDFRIDADYYRQYFFDLQNKILSINNSILKKISLNKTQRFKNNQDFDYLEISNISTTDASCTYQHIEKEYAPFRAQKILKNKDVVISTVRPNRNAVSFITEIEGFKVASSGFCVLRNFKKVLPEYIFVLFKTYIFRDLLNRETKATMYPAVSEEDILNLRIPIFSLNFQRKIAKIVRKLFQKQNQSKSLYSQAEQLLLSKLGLLDWEPKHELAFIKNYSDIQKAERFDAEYFQPKYEEIIEAVKKYKGGFIELKEVATTKRGSLISDNFYNTEKGTCYIRGADFSDGFLNDNKLIHIDNSFIPKSEVRVKTGDIVFALIGTVGSTALVDDNFDEAFISNNIGKIVVRKYNPIVLQVLFHSIIGKQYFEKEKTQTAQPKISDKDIHRFILPKLENDIEKKIETKYIESQKNKSLSKSLLEIAKRGVEIAIEKDEQEAEKWIEEKLKELK